MEEAAFANDLGLTGELREATAGVCAACPLLGNVLVLVRSPQPHTAIPKAFLAKRAVLWSLVQMAVYMGVQDVSAAYHVTPSRDLIFFVGGASGDVMPARKRRVRQQAS